MLNVDDVAKCRALMVLLYGEDPMKQAEALLDRSERLFGLDTSCADLDRSAMHRPC